MTVDVLGYLQRRAIGPVKRAGGNEVHTTCWWCNEDPNKRGRLYVNVDPEAAIPGLYHCKVCDAKGSFVTIQRHFGDEAKPEYQDFHTRHQILQAAAAYYHDALADHEDVFTWLRDQRGLSLETIVEHQLGWADGRLFRHLRDAGFPTKEIMTTGLCTDDRRTGRVVDSLTDMVTIPYHVAGNVTMIRGRAWNYDGNGPKYKTPPNQSTRLFNTDAAWHAEELVITEGEFDALVLKQLGFAAIGVPGANVWQDSFDGYLANVRRAYVVFDEDEAGQKGVEKLRDRFGPKVRRIELPAPEPGAPKNDPTQWIAALGHTAEEFRALLDAANAGGLLVTVDEAYVEHSEIQGLAGLQFGIDVLDTFISPGLLPAQLCVVLAKTGTGKTVFVLNMFQRMCMVKGQENLKCLFISLEQTRGEWFERARRIHRFYNLDADDQACLNFWRSRLLLVDKNRLSEAELVSVLDDFEYRVGEPPDLVAVDYLGYWAQSFKGDRYERTSDAVMAIKAVAKDRRLPVVAPHQVSRIAKDGVAIDADSARDAGVIEETADFILTLWTPDNIAGKDEDEKTGHVYLGIAKSRHGGRGKKVQLQFAPLSLALVPDQEPRQLVDRAHQELHYEHIKDTWEIAVKRHLGLMPQGPRAIEVARTKELMAPRARPPKLTQQAMKV